MNAPAEPSVNLLPGDPAPWLHARTSTSPRFAFDVVGGRYIVLCFFGSAADARSQAAISAVLAERELFNDTHASFFGVTIDRRDESETRVRESLPGFRFFFDFDKVISRLYGATPKDDAPASPTGSVRYRQFWLVLDPMLRVMKSVPFKEGAAAELLAFLRKLPPPPFFAGFEAPAPVLVLPRVFEPELCRELVALYDATGGQESGFMREIDGKTVLVTDANHKRRKDVIIEDRRLTQQLQLRVRRRIIPEIVKAHCFTPTRMERYIVSCYAAEDGGHFRQHRDNTTKGTAHRRFAVSINLNDDFDGGELSFPEFSTRQYKAPVGGAIVFGGALLHAVAPVRRGRRYAFLPFLYDEDAARLREANLAFLQAPPGDFRNARDESLAPTATPA